MKSKNVETLIRERAELRDLLEDIMRSEERRVGKECSEPC